MRECFFMFNENCFKYWRFFHIHLTRNRFVVVDTSMFILKAFNYFAVLRFGVLSQCFGHNIAPVNYKVLGRSVSYELSAQLAGPDRANCLPGLQERSNEVLRPRNVKGKLREQSGFCSRRVWHPLLSHPKRQIVVCFILRPHFACSSKTVCSRGRHLPSTGHKCKFRSCFVEIVDGKTQ